MKSKSEGEIRSSHDNLPIPNNRTDSEMPSTVREFAELLAEIAIQSLRSQPKTTQGENPHD